MRLAPAPISTVPGQRATVPVPAVAAAVRAGRDGGSRPDTGHGEKAWVNGRGHFGEPLTARDDQVNGNGNGNGSDHGRAGLEGDDLRLLTLLAGGLPANAVARKMNLSPRTLRRRTRALCDKIGVHTPIEAVAWAARRLLI